MRQEPIEIAMSNLTRAHKVGPISRRHRGELSTEAPRIVDEAFAHFEPCEHVDARESRGETGIMKQALVADLSAQLEAFDRQRERLARLLQSVEMSRGE